MSERYDLHCHSFFSDGTFSPKDLIVEAKRVGLKGLSITDHDTVCAYNEALFDFAEKKGVYLLVGIELSCVFDHKSVHVLGYGIDYKNESFLKYLQVVQRNRKKRNDQILQKLHDRKIKIDDSDFDVSEDRSFIIGRPHIAAAMIKKGYVSNMQEAFDLYLKDRACCYVEGNKSSVYEGIEQIQLAGGKAVLAHPHFYQKSIWISKLLSCPFDGVEGYYGKMLPIREQKWVQIGMERGWIVTGGSDFHGSIKPHIQLGCSWVGKEIIKALESKGKKALDSGSKTDIEE